MNTFMKVCLLLIFFHSSSYAFYTEELQLNAAHWTDKLVITSNKFDYTFDLPANTEVVLRVLLTELTNVDNVEVILPDGTSITAVNQVQYGISITTFIPSIALDELISPSKALIVTLDAEYSGNIQIKGDVSGNIPASLPLDMQFIGADVNFSTSYSPKQFLHVNDEITFSQFILENNSAPQNTVIVELDIYQSGELLSTHLMKDDGLLNDSEASDGVYAKTISFDIEGKYTIRIQSIVTDSQGNTHKNVDTKTIEIRPNSPFSLTGTFTEQLIDNNGNGLADKLKLSFDYNNAPAADEKYRIQVIIGSGNKFYDMQTLIFDSTTAELAFHLNGLEIGKNHIDGPIEIQDVRIKDLNTGNFIEILKSFGVTASYLTSQFERPNEIINQSDATFSFEDADNNKIYEGINIYFIADVATDGNYQAKGRLKNTEGEFILGKIDTPLTSGIHPLTIFIPAEKIISSGFNGPADFIWFMFYRYDVNNWEMIERSKFGATAPFNC